MNMSKEFLDTTVSESRIKYIQELEEKVFGDIVDYKHMDIVILYCLRDLEMKIDPKEQIIWSLDKLHLYKKRRPELIKFYNTTDLFDFYNSCTISELLTIGY